MSRLEMSRHHPLLRLWWYDQLVFRLQYFCPLHFKNFFMLKFHAHLSASLSFLIVSMNDLDFYWIFVDSGTRQGSLAATLNACPEAFIRCCHSSPLFHLSFVDVYFAKCTVWVCKITKFTWRFLGGNLVCTWCAVAALFQRGKKQRNLRRPLEI